LETRVVIKAERIWGSLLRGALGCAKVWAGKIRKATPSSIKWSGNVEDLAAFGWELYLFHFCGIDSKKLLKEVCGFEEQYGRGPISPDSGQTPDELIQQIMDKGNPENPTVKFWEIGVSDLALSALPKEETKKIFRWTKISRRRPELDTFKVELSRPGERALALLLLPAFDKALTLCEKYKSVLEFSAKDVDDLLRRWDRLIHLCFEDKGASSKVNHMPRAVGLWLWDEAESRNGRKRPGVIATFKAHMGVTRSWGNF
jgi:hypothetical protein